MSSSLKHKIVSGIFWQGLERIGSQGISFLVSVLLARLLAPKEFGIIAIITVFIGFCSVFVDSGFSAALIQKKKLEEDDCCSVFFINIVMAFVLYGVLFITAPAIADFYDNPCLALYLRVLALVLVIRSFSLVQGALLMKRMLFHLNFRINWCALLISGGVGIAMASLGYGVWALIVQQLICAGITGFMQWLLVQWRPRLIFDPIGVKTLFQFGWKLFCSGLLESIYNNAYALIIGKLFNLTTLSYFNRGRSIPALGMGIINSAVGSVIFPVFSGMQDDRAQMRRIAEKSLKNIMFLVIPILVVLMILAKPLVVILLTKKWLPCVIFLQLCCLNYLTWPLHTLNLQIISACGRSDIFLILEIIKKVQLFIMILITWRWGVIAMVAGLSVTGVLAFIENAWANRKLIGYSPWRQFCDILPFLLTATIAGIFSGFLFHLISGVWLQLFVCGGSFGIFYFLGTWIIKKVPQDLLGLIIREKKFA